MSGIPKYQWLPLLLPESIFSFSFLATQMVEKVEEVNNFGLKGLRFESWSRSLEKYKANDLVHLIHASPEMITDFQF